MAWCLLSNAYVCTVWFLFMHRDLLPYLSTNALSRWVQSLCDA